LSAIQNFSAPKGKLELGGGKEKGFFESFFDNFLDKIKNLISSVIAGGLGYKLIKDTINKVIGEKPGKPGTTPAEEVKKTGAVGESKSKRFKEALSKGELEELEKKGYKYDEKRGVFTKDGKLVKTESVSKELGEAGAKKYAAAATSNKKVVAEVVEKKIAKSGVKSFLKKIPLVGVALGSAFGLARAMEGDSKGAVAEVVSGASGSIPVVGTAAGIAVDAALIARDTYKELYGVFPEDDDPELVEERKQEIIETIEEKFKKFSTGESTVEPGALTEGVETTGTLTPYTETSTETKPTATPAPMGESKAGAGRGNIAGPTAEEMEMAPAPTPTPIPRMVPEITPTPEMPPVPSMMQEPIIQTNTNTNIIGGKKDRVLATSTPKQRNTDLNRYLSNGSVAV
jgi:hypothetical protein